MDPELDAILEEVAAAMVPFNPTQPAQPDPLQQPPPPQPPAPHPMTTQPLLLPPPEQNLQVAHHSSDYPPQPLCTAFAPTPSFLPRPVPPFPIIPHLPRPLPPLPPAIPVDRVAPPRITSALPLPFPPPQPLIQPPQIQPPPPPQQPPANDAAPVLDRDGPERPPRPRTVDLEPPNLQNDHATLIQQLRLLRPDLPDEAYRNVVESADAAALRQGMSLEPYPFDFATNYALDSLLDQDTDGEDMVDQAEQAPLQTVAPEAQAQPPPPPPPPPPPTPEEIVQRVTEMFPRVDVDWIWAEIDRGATLEAIVDAVMDPNRNVPKKASKRKAAEESEVAAASSDYFSRPLEPRPAAYRKAAEAELGNRFPRLWLGSIREILTAYAGNFAPALKALQEELTDDFHKSKKSFRAGIVPTSRNLAPPGAEKAVGQLRFIQSKRAAKNWHDAALAKEVAWVEAQMTAKEAAAAAKRRREEEEAQAAQNGETMECEICCSEASIRAFLACRDGHLFCKECVKGQAHEVIHGRGGHSVSCLESGCGAGFGPAVLAEVLSEKERGQLEKLAGAAAVAGAGLSDFEGCRYCAWGAELPPPAVDKVFRCGGCGEVYCRLCGRDWDEEHMGRRCEELETDATTAARKQKEEALSAAILRRCHKCGLPFQKEAGCNKMTCNCGATSCYLCHAPNIGYDHFCRHLREPPGSACKQCKGCNLYEDPSKRDAERIKDVHERIPDP